MIFPDFEILCLLKDIYTNEKLLKNIVCFELFNN